MDEWEEPELVWDALRTFARQDAAWGSNLTNFGRKDRYQRHHWWQLAKKQAEKGLPFMQKLLLEVIKLRMQS